MTFDINNIVRSVVIGAAILPVSLNLGGLLGVQKQAAVQNLEVSARKEQISKLQDQLQVPCIRYAISKADSKLERQAKNTIDEAFGGDVLHGKACNMVLNFK